MFGLLVAGDTGHSLSLCLPRRATDDVGDWPSTLSRRPRCVAWYFMSGRDRRVGCRCRRRFEPYADWRLSYGHRSAPGAKLEFRRTSTDSAQTRRMAQVGVHTHIFVG